MGRAGGIWMARDYGHHAAAQVEVLRMGPYLPANPAVLLYSPWSEDRGYGAILLRSFRGKNAGDGC